MSFFKNIVSNLSMRIILAGIIKSTEGTVKYSQAPLPTSLIFQVFEWSQGEMGTRVALHDGMDASLDGRPLPRPASTTGSSRLPLRHAWVRVIMREVATKASWQGPGEKEEGFLPV